jgi:hypothetical protein
MGRKPADRVTQKGSLQGAAHGLDMSVPCRCCGAASRVIRPRWRVCANGHTFVKKSDQ